MSTEVTEKVLDFEAMVGEEMDFYGVDGNCFKLDEVVYEAIENEDDGSCSMLGCVEVVEGEKHFFRLPIARVIIESDNEEHFDGYKLTDLHDGHCWLRFGTESYNDYYPCFVFEYSPKAL